MENWKICYIFFIGSIDVMKELNIKNILIMSSFQNLREKHICMNKEKEYFRYLVEYPQNIKNNPLKKMDECSIPYFFVTDEKCHLRKLFFPTKSNLMLTRRYIYTICSCYNIEWVLLFKPLNYFHIIPRSVKILFIINIIDMMLINSKIKE